MARNGSGGYIAPAGNPVVTNTVIQSNWANTLVSDLGTEITNSLPRDGQAGMLATLKIIDGSAVAPSLAFSSDINAGLFRPGSNALGVSVAGAEQLRVVNGAVLIGQTSNTSERLQVTGAAKVTGTLNVSGAVTFGGTASITGAVTIGAAVGSTDAVQKSYVDGFNSWTKVVVTGTTQTATAGNHYVLTNTGGVTTLTLPASPNAGDTIYITNATTRTDAIMARNGQLLFGLAEDFTFDKTNATICIRYVDATYGWRAA